MTSFEIAIAIAHPLATIVLASLAIRSRVRSRSAHSSSFAFVATVAGIVACALLMLIAGARWWLRPAWASLGMLSIAASTILTALWLTAPSSSKHKASQAPR